MSGVCHVRYLDPAEHPDHGRPRVLELHGKAGEFSVHVQRDTGALWCFASGARGGHRGQVVLSVRRAQDVLDWLADPSHYLGGSQGYMTLRPKLASLYALECFKASRISGSTWRLLLDKPARDALVGCLRSWAQQVLQAAQQPTDHTARSRSAGDLSDHEGEAKVAFDMQDTSTTRSSTMEASSTTAPEATADTNGTPTDLEAAVKRAIKAAGGTVKDLTDEQRARAETATTDKPGLAGKALGTWILDGADLKAQADAAKQANAAKAADVKKANRSAAAKRAGNRPPDSGSKYPADVREAVKAAKELRGKPDGLAPKQHQHIRTVVTAALKKDKTDLTPQALVDLAGAKSMKHLREIATGVAPREDLAVLKPLAEQMGPDPYSKGRLLAAHLVVWAEQVKAAK